MCAARLVVAEVPTLGRLLDPLFVSVARSREAMASQAVPAVRDALALGALLLERGEEVFRDADFTVRVLESRLERSGAALGALREAAADGQGGQAALAALRAAPLAGTLASCEAAAASLRELQANREGVISARREALAARAEAMQQARDALVAGVQAQMQEANAGLLRDLRAIAAAAPAAAQDGTAGSAAAAAAAAAPPSPDQQPRRV